MSRARHARYARHACRAHQSHASNVTHIVHCITHHTYHSPLHYHSSNIIRSYNPHSRCLCNSSNLRWCDLKNTNLYNRLKCFILYGLDRARFSVEMLQEKRAICTKGMAKKGQAKALLNDFSRIFSPALETNMFLDLWLAVLAGQALCQLNYSYSTKNPSQMKLKAW